ncbi:uncharacterized protein LOC134188034 [Corticium candelabrum]|uniref:uncharacterized protein LOC134188034 n=1 Tax=Corticium candelabrum TaxID=121492 RepID=UPI002E258F51|nr:uncharacterized protein LOC134188034 [Corticium candelabrum]
MGQNKSSMADDSVRFQSHLHTTPSSAARMSTRQPIKPDPLELQPVKQTADRLRADIAHTGNLDPFDDFLPSRPRAAMTTLHSPHMSADGTSNVLDGLEIISVDEPEGNGRKPIAAAAAAAAAREGVGAVSEMSDEEIAWKLWREENEAVQQRLPGRYHADDEQLARILQEEFDLEARHIREQNVIAQIEEPMPQHGIRIIQDSQRRSVPVMNNLQSTPLSDHAKEKDGVHIESEHHRMREQLDRDLLDIDTPEQARKTQGTTDTSTESSLDEITTEDVHQELINPLSLNNSTSQDYVQLSEDRRAAVADTPLSMINDFRSEITIDDEEQPTLEIIESTHLPRSQRERVELPTPPLQHRFARPGQADVEEHPLLQLIRAMRSPTSFEDLIDIEERLGCMMRGADERMIRSTTFAHKFIKGSAGEDNKCTVCMCEFVEKEDVRRLPCMHLYHVECIDEWLKRNRICPVCRVRIDAQ